MQLTPRYGGTPVLRFDPPVADPDVPLLRQRRRLVATLAGFDAERWAAPSRCAGWACRDVVSHLVTVNRFWAASITAGRAGSPTRFLVGFEPAVTPAQLVDGGVRGPRQGTARPPGRQHRVPGGGGAGLDADGWARDGRGTTGSCGHQRGGRARVVGRLDPRAGHLPTTRHRCAGRGRRGRAASATPSPSGRPSWPPPEPAAPDRSGSTPRTRRWNWWSTWAPIVVVRDATPGDDVRPEVRGSAVELVESFSLRSGPPVMPASGPVDGTTPWPRRSTRAASRSSAPGPPIPPGPWTLPSPQAAPKRTWRSTNAR